MVDLRLLESEVVSRLKLVCLIIKLILLVQFSPRMTRPRPGHVSVFAAPVLDTIAVDWTTDDVFVCRDFVGGAVDPSAVEDVAGRG
jgi:hypothetical protein